MQSYCETFAATTTSAGIRIIEEESLSIESIGEIELRIYQVKEAF
jgi:hypothetical protein